MEQDLRFPIGEFKRGAQPTEEQRRQLIEAIAEAPARLAAAVTGLNSQQMDTPYRPGGWTVRQVVHHVPDSHMNAYVRCKLALTENEPTIKPYNETLWAELVDSKETPTEVSLALLENLHKRWVILLRSLAPADWSRKLRHPEMGTITLDDILVLYAWHGRHHVAQITSLRERNGWEQPRLILRYRSGEEMMKGDRVLYHGNPAQVELVSSDANSNDPEEPWHMQEFGGGVMVLYPMVSGHTFIPADQIEEYEDLEFLQRAEKPHTSEPNS
jgi:uncharacterized damage-inducible protein DinB